MTGYPHIYCRDRECCDCNEAETCDYPVANPEALLNGNAETATVQVPDGLQQALTIAEILRLLAEMRADVDGLLRVQAAMVHASDQPAA
jgi:hypothetical protein